LELKSISNSFAFFISQMVVFVNSQNNMGREKRAYLQEFGIIDFPKSKVGPTSQFFSRELGFRTKSFVDTR
jgi:hypothetical protein